MVQTNLRALEASQVRTIRCDNPTQQWKQQLIFLIAKLANLIRGIKLLELLDGWEHVQQTMNQVQIFAILAHRKALDNFLTIVLVLDLDVMRIGVEAAEITLRCSIRDGHEQVHDFGMVLDRCCHVRTQTVLIIRELTQWVIANRRLEHTEFELLVANNACLGARRDLVHDVRHHVQE